MSPQEAPSITLFWYEPQISNAKRASACWGELIGITWELLTIRDQLQAAIRRKDSEDRARLCQYHHENFLMRVYSMRERVWDILACLTDTERKGTSNKSFRNVVLATLRANYPTIADSFEHLSELIKQDVETRNTATHKTFLIMGLFIGGQLYHLQELLEDTNPDEPDGELVHRTAREALSRYVRDQSNHIDAVRATVRDFAMVCDDPIRAIDRNET